VSWTTTSTSRWPNVARAVPGPRPIVSVYSLSKAVARREHEPEVGVDERVKAGDRVAGDVEQQDPMGPESSVRLLHVHDDRRAAAGGGRATRIRAIAQPEAPLLKNRPMAADPSTAGRGGMRSSASSRGSARSPSMSVRSQAST
jgi:hypothetical protein